MPPEKSQVRRLLSRDSLYELLSRRMQMYGTVPRQTSVCHKDARGGAERQVHGSNLRIGRNQRLKIAKREGNRVFQQIVPEKMYLRLMTTV